MKRIILTFDDGRGDNYLNAFPIMKKYGLVGTVFITTGYIDGSYVNSEWKSAGTSMDLPQLMEMRDYGFEMALHGDRHTTETDDFDVSLKKIREWGLFGKDESVGFSIPNSDVKLSKIDELKEKFKKEQMETDSERYFAQEV